MKITKKVLLGLIRESILKETKGKTRINELSPEYVRRKINADFYDNPESKRKVSYDDRGYMKDRNKDYDRSERYIFEKLGKYAESLGLEIIKSAGSYDPQFMDELIVQPNDPSYRTQKYESYLEKLSDDGDMSYMDFEDVIFTLNTQSGEFYVNQAMVGSMRTEYKANVLKLLRKCESAYSDGGGDSSLSINDLMSKRRDILQK